MSQAEIRIWSDRPEAVINPDIYGHFAEHIGRCVYEGIWVGPESRIPNDGGIRLDVIAALKQLRAPVVRWPGGCFADVYHWRDGIGPIENRPSTVNIWWKQTEPNTFGTDEYMRFCRAVGCESYICVNVGSGSPREALDWLEYCNFGGDSTLTAMRSRNGSPEPYGVKYWGVGNENWGCGGRFTATDYATEYTRFSSYMRQLDPSIALIACGYSPCDANPSLHAWNHDFCNTMRQPDLIDLLSVHRYFSRGQGAAFSDSEFHALFGDLHAMERDLLQTEQLLAYFYPDKHVGIAVDEWGVWHPSAVVDNGTEQESTLRDAVFAGACLNLFNRHARHVTMANLAQTVNVLQCVAITRGSRMCLTPTYHVFDMMRPHMGAKALTHEVLCDAYDARPVNIHKPMPVPVLSTSVSRQGRKLLLTVANQTIDKDIEARVCLRDARIASATVRALQADDPRIANTIDHPSAITPGKPGTVGEKGEVVYVFPRHSFTAMRITLE